MRNYCQKPTLNSTGHMVLSIVLAVLISLQLVSFGESYLSSYRKVALVSPVYKGTRITPNPLFESQLQNSNNVEDKSSSRNSIFEPLRILWDFSRPHTLIGSGLSILSLYLHATPQRLWFSEVFTNSLVAAIIPSLLMNIYITGLNQVTDIEIDKLNKPYLPIPSGALSKQQAINIILASLLGSLWLILGSSWPLKMTVIGSAILGTLYSLPPFRLKRFPLLAAFCILIVRGTLVNLGFWLQAKIDVVGASISSISQAIRLYPQSAVVALFFAIYGLAIAILKDVPDVSGDEKHSIRTFSVRMGAQRMLRFGSTLLSSLLGAVSWYLLRKFFTVEKQVLNALLGLFAAFLAVDVHQKATKVDATDSNEVFQYYMHIWKVFYACYIFLPFVR